MFVRVVQFTGARDLPGGVEFVRENVAPQLRQQRGYQGLTVSCDWSRGIFGVLSMWESAADRDASESTAEKARTEGLDIVGGSMSVEHYEQVTLAAAGIPAVGSPLVVQRLHMDPAMVDDNLDYFEREVRPFITAQPGFLALRQMIDRESGRAIVGTVWADVAAMHAALADSAPRQRAAAGRVTFDDVSEREICFIDLP